MSAQERKVVRKKKKFGLVVEFIPVIRDLVPDDDTKKKINGELKRAKGITPSYLADKYNIRVSTAKRILREAEANNIVKKVISSRRTKVYSASAE
jgi:ribosomal protein S25